MSAPAVSGAVALLLADAPELSVSEVRRLLRLSARDLGPPGHDSIYGPGALDLPALLELRLPDLELVLEEPETGRIHDPEAAPIEILGRAAGGDLSSYSIAFARGLEAGPFVEIQLADSIGGVDGVLARWDARQLADGPVVLRLRAELRDGRTLDEHTVFSLERNRPLRISQGADREGEPSLWGQTVVWRAFARGIDGRDVVRIGGVDRRGRPRLPRLLHESDRAQRQAIVSSGRVVWLETDPETSGDRLMNCRLKSRFRSRPRCRAASPRLLNPRSS